MIDDRRLFSIGLEEPPERLNRRPQEIEIELVFEKILDRTGAHPGGDRQGRPFSGSRAAGKNNL